ncbi:FAD binding domain-containing protein [Sarocladium implicatum]|nr:FAD binding domain-containing protein [Sarocladium implicatum]
MLHQIAAVATLFFSLASTSPQHCRATPGSVDWPSSETWAGLNDTLSGRLIKPTLAAAVCWPHRPEYNPEKCREVFKAWQTQEFFTNDPIVGWMGQWSDWSCLPRDPDESLDEAASWGGPADEAAMPSPGQEDTMGKYSGNSTITQRWCSGDGYPAYVVNATSAHHVKAAIDFAQENNVRLTIKNTGHDVTGRYTAPGSLAVWTHHMKGIEYHQDSFTTDKSNKVFEGDHATVGAGCQLYEVQRKAHEHGKVFPGGNSKTVGISGFVSGGGHSILSPHFGLAADNVVQMEVVTAGGEILTINEDQHADLFWALRGAGGSTFGVITSLTLRLHPDRPIESITMHGIAEPDSEVARELATWVLSMTTYLMDNGITGFLALSHSFVAPTPILGYKDNPLMGGFELSAIFYNPLNDTSIETTLQQLQSSARSRWGDAVQIVFTTRRYNSYLDWWEVNHDQVPGGQNTYLMSRLLNRKTLSADDTSLREMIEPAMKASFGLAAYMVAGDSLQEPKVPGLGHSAHPAWTDHMVFALNWATPPPYDKEANAEAVRNLYQGWRPIREALPEGGSYINEGLPYEENWQQVYWGDKYEKLLKIKREIDPDDVFWCRPCVGHDRWEEVDSDDGRRLCSID